MPRADIYATSSGVVVSLEVPGIPPDDIQITVEGRTLTVEGQRNRGLEPEDAEYLEAGRPAGRFARSFALSSEPGDVTAGMADGVLTISLQGRGQQ